MSGIMLKAQNIHQHTLINNLFIDHYMPRANGDYVKVYIYILRLVVSGGSDFTTKQVARQMNLIESDVIRALKYWAKEKVIEVTFEDDVLTAIGFLSLEKTEAVATGSQTTQKPSATTPQQKEKPAAKTVSIYERHQYSPEELILFKRNEEFLTLLHMTERYMGKTLSQPNINILTNLVDQLNMPIEVVEYLIEYCVSNNHRSFKYIESVALDWFDSGIKTVEAAKTHTSGYNKNYYRIFKALGINNRQPIPDDMKYMDKWLNDYNFALEVIELACSKTITAINKPALSYVDTILTRWHNKGVKSLEAIEELDRSYRQNKDKSKDSKTSQTKTKNKFHNHQQREYDFDDIDKRMDDLLDKHLRGME